MPLTDKVPSYILTLWSMCVWCIYVYICVLKYLSIHVCVEARGWHQCLAQLLFHLIFLREGSSMNLEFAISVRMPGQQAPRSCLFLHRKPWDTGVLYAVLGTWKHFLMHKQQELYMMRHLPGSSCQHFTSLVHKLQNQRNQSHTLVIDHQMVSVVEKEGILTVNNAIQAS